MSIAKWQTSSEKHLDKNQINDMICLIQKEEV